MFTGIVEEVGTLARIERRAASASLHIDCQTVTEDARLGDSISVSGCCLTVTTLPAEGGFTADLMGETLDRTSLGALREGDAVNLERAMKLGDRLGGHLVQGHVDGVGVVEAIEPQQDWTVLRVRLPEGLGRYLVEKGSITLDGTSLTVVEVSAEQFSVGLIPHTLAATSLAQRRAGDPVNLEVDVVAKYVERMLADRDTGTSPNAHKGQS